MLKLTLYFVLLFVGLVLVGTMKPESLSFMPLGGTILVMLPITWTYIATRSEVGF